MQLFLFAVDLFDEKVAGVKGLNELVVGFGEGAREFPRFSGERLRKRSADPGELCVDFLPEKGPGEPKRRAQRIKHFGIEIAADKGGDREVVEEMCRHFAGGGAERAGQVLLSAAFGGYTIQEDGPLEPAGKTLGESRTGQKAVKFGVGDKQAESIYA